MYKRQVVAVSAEHGNPYDGRLLKSTVSQAEKNTGEKVKDVFVDKSYRGCKHHPEGVGVFISGRKNLPRKLKSLLKGRSGIEPIIGHLKNDHRLSRNYLLGIVGDKINAVLSACAFNLKKILRLGFVEKSALITV